MDRDFIYTNDVLEKMTSRQIENYREKLSVIGKRNLDNALSNMRDRKREEYHQSDKYKQRLEYIKPKKRSFSDFFRF